MSDSIGRELIGVLEELRVLGRRGTLGERMLL